MSGIGVALGFRRIMKSLSYIRLFSGQHSQAKRLPIGSEVMATGGVHFRVWAPKCERIEVVFSMLAGTPAIAPLELVAEDGGYFAGVASAALAGMLYHLRLNGRDQLIPDPVSRFQPDGPHGPSQIIDPDPFAWSDSGWLRCSAARSGAL